MEELNIEEMTALRGGGKHKKAGTNIEVENLTVNQANSASIAQANSSTISIG
jgi:hypothetical protein